MAGGGVSDRLVDLQTHSTFSDGTFTPSEIVNAAADAGLAAVALTDHDTVEGQAEMIEAGKAHGVEIIPGVELSVQMPQQGIDVLGYLIDPEAPELIELLQDARAWRAERLPKMLDALEAAGVSLDEADVRAQASGDVVGRPHVAQALVEAGYAQDTDEAFETYIGDGKPGYVAKQRIPPERAIDTIHAAGGLAVLAHPCFVHPAYLGDLLVSLVRLGLDGIEVWYSEHDGQHVQAFTSLAHRFSLVKTGGSDFHGGNKPGIEIGSGRGDLAVPYSAVEALRARKAAREAS